MDTEVSRGILKTLDKEILRSSIIFGKRFMILEKNSEDLQKVAKKSLPLDLPLAHTQVQNTVGI